MISSIIQSIGWYEISLISDAHLFVFRYSFSKHTHIGLHIWSEKRTNTFRSSINWLATFEIRMNVHAWNYSVKPHND